MTCWSSNRASERGRRGFKWLWTRNVVGADGLVWVFQKLLIYWDFHTQPSLGFTENDLKKKISSEQQLCGWKCLVDVRGQRRMCRLVRDDRKTTVTQTTTRYNQGIQNTISEHTTRRTLKHMDSSSRRPHRVLLLSAKRTWHGGYNSHRLTRIGQNRRLEKSCLVWWVWWYSDGRVRIWRKRHEKHGFIPALSQRFGWVWWCVV